MTNNWTKLGQIYTHNENNNHPKLLTHAANPIAVLAEGDIYRIFFSSRDCQNKSSVGAFDFDIVKRKVIQQFQHPFFTYGSLDSYYADGVSIGDCYSIKDTKYMLFMGWQTKNNAMWCGQIGRLIVTENLTLELADTKPLLESDKIDPISLSYPCVIPDQNGGYHMWYGSTKTWDAGNNEMLHVINYASSTNGNLWNRKGLSVPYELGTAQVFSRPTVTGNNNDGYEMWFSYRGGYNQKYKIGYATSDDGKKWVLSLEQAGITVSDSGWDSEMIEYPYVFNHKGSKYMLYNGNNYGKTGIGLAIQKI